MFDGYSEDNYLSQIPNNRPKYETPKWSMQDNPDGIIHIPMFGKASDPPHKRWFNRWKGDIAATAISVFSAHTMILLVKDISKLFVGKVLKLNEDRSDIASVILAFVISFGILMVTITLMDKRNIAQNQNQNQNENDNNNHDS
jgi:hypothetical protein